MQHMIDFIKRATNGITKPIKVETLEDLLIDEGITEAVKLSGLKSIKKGMLTKWMKEAGFVRKQIMSDGDRNWCWVNSSIGKTGLNAKIALKEFLNDYLKLKESISYDELSRVLTDEGFTIETWNGHFYHTDGNLEGTAKVWNNWVLKGKSGEKIYTKLSSDGENSAE